MLGLIVSSFASCRKEFYVFLIFVLKIIENKNKAACTLAIIIQICRILLIPSSKNRLRDDFNCLE